jgi:hypothetical protein
VVKPTEILYYKSPESLDELSGDIPLEGSVVLDGVNAPGIVEVPEFGFTISASGRQHYFACNDAQQVDEWKQVIVAAQNSLKRKPAPARMAETAGAGMYDEGAFWDDETEEAPVGKSTPAAPTRVMEPKKDSPGSRLGSVVSSLKGTAAAVASLKDEKAHFSVVWNPPGAPKPSNLKISLAFRRLATTACGRLIQAACQKVKVDPETMNLWAPYQSKSTGALGTDELVRTGVLRDPVAATRPLDRTAKGVEYGLADGVRLFLHPVGDPNPPVFHSAEAAASGVFSPTAIPTTTPAASPGHPRGFEPSASQEEPSAPTAVPGPKGPAPSPAPIAAKPEAASTPKTPASTTTPVRDTESLRASAQARLARRLHLGSLFDDLMSQRGVSSEQDALPTAAVEAALRADPTVASWKGSEKLFAAVRGMADGVKKKQLMDAHSQLGDQLQGGDSVDLTSLTEGGSPSLAGAADKAHVPAPLAMALRRGGAAMRAVQAETRDNAMVENVSMKMSVQLTDDLRGDITVAPFEDTSRLVETFFQQCREGMLSAEADEERKSGIPAMAELDEEFGDEVRDEVRKVQLGVTERLLRNVMAQREDLVSHMRSILSRASHAGVDCGVEISEPQASSSAALDAAEVESEVGRLRGLLAGVELERDSLRRELDATRAALASTAPASDDADETRVLKHQLSEAVTELEGARSRVRELEDSLKRGEWEAHVKGQAEGGAMLTRDEWRAWAAEKRSILARANADRAALAEENRRLREAQNPQAAALEMRFRRADEARTALEAQVASLSAARRRAEEELRSAYRQWDEDGQAWSAERRRLQEQIEALAIAASQAAAEGAATAAEAAGITSADAAAGEIRRLLQEKASLLRAWSTDTEVLVASWKDDRRSVQASIERVRQRLSTLERQCRSAVDLATAPLEASTDAQALSKAAPALLHVAEDAVAVCDAVKREMEAWVTSTPLAKAVGKLRDELASNSMHSLESGSDSRTPDSIALQHLIAATGAPSPKVAPPRGFDTPASVRGMASTPGRVHEVSSPSHY